MARFAKYYSRFKHDAFPTLEWCNRQQHLALLLESDESIMFTSKDKHDASIKHFNHRVYHLGANPDITVMQIANSIDIPLEQHYEPAIAHDEPSCFVIIDNRSGLRTVAIQKKRKAFSGTNQVASILSTSLSKQLYNDHCYCVEILPEYLPDDLFSAWSRMQEHTTSLVFDQPDMEIDEIIQKVNEMKKLGKPYYSNDSLMASVLEQDLAMKQAGYRNQRIILPQEAKVSLSVDTTSPIMRTMLTLSHATNTPVVLKTKDGATFRCLIDGDSENTDKVMCYDFDDALLSQLFTRRGKDGEPLAAAQIDKIEAGIIELMNQMKHPADPEEEKEDAA